MKVTEKLENKQTNKKRNLRTCEMQLKQSSEEYLTFYLYAVETTLKTNNPIFHLKNAHFFLPKKSEKEQP